MSQLNSFFNDDYSEEQKPFVKVWIDKLTDAIDNGAFFREPAVFVYRAIGVLCFVFLLLSLLFLGDVDRSLDYMFFSSGAAVNGIFLFLVLLAMGVFIMMIWINRSNKLRSRIKTGSDIAVIPLAVDFFQTCFECYGLVVMFVPSVCAVYIGFIGQLFLDAGSYSQLLITCLGIAVGCVIIGYVIVAFGHLLGESLRALATITNNVRDLGDIHRAATMTEEPQEPQPIGLEEQSEEEQTETDE